MNGGTVLKLSVRDGYAILQTYSHAHGLSPQFYLAEALLAGLETTGKAVAIDAPCFASLNTCHDIGSMERLRLQFTWLSLTGNEAVHGRRELLELDYAQFRALLEKSRTEGGAWQRLLALKEKPLPSIRLESGCNLR